MDYVTSDISNGSISDLMNITNGFIESTILLDNRSQEIIMLCPVTTKGMLFADTLEHLFWGQLQESVC